MVVVIRHAVVLVEVEPFEICEVVTAHDSADCGQPPGGHAEFALAGQIDLVSRVHAVGDETGHFLLGESFRIDLLVGLMLDLQFLVRGFSGLVSVAGADGGHRVADGRQDHAVADGRDGLSKRQLKGLDGIGNVTVSVVGRGFERRDEVS